MKKLIVLAVAVSGCANSSTAPILECRYDITIGQPLPVISVSPKDTACKMTDERHEYVEFVRIHGVSP